MTHRLREERRPRVDTGLAASIGPKRGGRKRDRHRLKPSLQVLEGRRLMATFTVTSTADTLTKGQPTEGTLRWAVVQADMRDFSLSRQFDLVITMLNSLCHLLTLDDLLRHLASVARHLAPGSLYITELAHPADIFGAERRTSSEWSSEVDGGTVRVRWGGGTDEIDPVTQITREHVSVTYHKRGGSLRTVTDVVPNRFWTATELTAAIRLAGGFAVVASYGDFDADTPVEAADAWRMILVLRREDAASELPGPPVTATTTPASTSTTPVS